MRIRDMATMAHANAAAKGFHSPKPSVGEQIALIHSEVSEALEAYRDGSPFAALTDANGKPIGIGSELADIVIRVGDTAESLGIDLEGQVIAKMAYNATRAHRHGGKKL